MTCSPDVNYEELARSTDEFNGAQLKAVCVEAGMFALREGAKTLSHEHFLSGIAEGMFVLPISTDTSVDWSLQCKAKRRMTLCISPNSFVSYIVRLFVSEG
jgi:SpoVK/Ycf46/Vps4 family AAA+-type ATPase